MEPEMSQDSHGNVVETDDIKELGTAPEPKPAEPTEGKTDAPEGDETAPEGEVKKEPAPKLLTQDEVNNIVQREKAKAEAKAERRAMRQFREVLDRAIPAQSQQPQGGDDGRPRQEQFANVDDYVDAVTEWKFAQRDRAIAQQRHQAQQERLTSKTEAVYAKAEAIEGFDREAFDDLPLTPAIAAAVTESESAAELMAYMALHPDDVARISRLHPARQAAEIGKLELKATAAPPKVTKAPPPVRPIGAKAGGSKNPADMTDAEYAEWRRKGRAQL